MSRKVLIIYESSTQRIYFGYFPPLGALYIAAYLKSKRVPVDVIDRNIDACKSIDYCAYDIVGFSVNSNNIANTLKTAQIIKRENPSCIIAVGGPYGTAMPEDLIPLDNIDLVFTGEGEKSFYEFVSGKKPEDIKGVYSKKGGQIYYSGAGDLIGNLDELPFPALDMVDVSRYNTLITKKLPVSSLITSRGCVYQCIFCFHALGSKWRGRSLKNVVDEVQWRVENCGVKEIAIQDDDFSFNLERAKNIFDEIIQRKLKVSIQFGNGVRSDCVDEEFMKKAKAAGVWNINFAPETGSKETFTKLKKRFTLDDAVRAIRMAKKENLITTLYMMVGFPWEKREHYFDSFRFIEELDPDFVDITKATPFPKTELYRLFAASNYKKKEFTDEGYFFVSATEDKTLISLVNEFYRSFYFRLGKLWRIFLHLRFYHPSRLRMILKVDNIFLIFHRLGFISQK